MSVLPIGDLVVRPIRTIDPRASPDNEFTYVDIASVDNRAKRITRLSRLLGRDAPSRARQQLKVHDVLVATTRPYLNAVARVSGDLDGQVASTAFCVLRPGPNLDSEFLWYWTRHPAFVSGLSALVQGALYPAVTDKDVLAQTIPYLPIEQQRRLAGLLSDRLSTVERVRRAADEQEAGAVALLKATIRAAFMGTTRSGRRSLGELAQVIRGVTFTRDEASSASGAGLLPVLRAGNIGPELMLDEGLVWVPEQRISRSQKLRIGDIAMSLSSGSPGVVGKTAVLRTEFDGAVGAFCAVIRAERDVDPTYLAWWFRSDMYLEWRDTQARGASIQNLRVSELEKIRVPLPELPEQRRIAADLERHLESIGRLRASMTARLDRIEALQTAVLRQGFAEHGAS